MSTKVKNLDVWLTDGNVVYKEVPFTVVIDWIQQGRLLEEDQVKPAGTEKWFKIASSKALAAYLPKPEPFASEDQAEALEPVDVDFSYKKPHEEGEDDPDMIPLIDVSLVLLVFFMMTATVIVSSNTLNVPTIQSDKAWLDNPTHTMWIGIERVVGEDGWERPPKYSYGKGTTPAPTENQGLTEAEVVQKLSDELRQRNELIDLRIAADKQLPAETVMSLTAVLENLRPSYIRNIRAEVNEAKK
jgi:biopolymer transport protein ExbD